MRVPESLANAFGKDFQTLIADFAFKQGLLPDASSIESPRFLSRSIVPHISKLSALFNREQIDQDSALDPYWKESSHPAHLRLAYFLYFMPCNLLRAAGIWAELGRLGYRWPHAHLQGIEFGAGPASGVCGIAAGERYSDAKLPATGSWALIEQDLSVLKMGAEWAQSYFSHLGEKDWNLKTFHRKLDVEQGLLPRKAPKFNFWLMSFYLNEVSLSPQQMAASLLRDWENHLEEEGIVIIVEPALKLQSRRLLELRKHLLLEAEKSKIDWLKILLPCLGHQACGALSNPEDWCHDEVTWWRPPYFRVLDQMAGLDRKTLPMSYLVLTRSRRPREEILPAIASSPENERYRLVSPAHAEGRDLEFFVCGQDGKRRARYRPEAKSDPELHPKRGDILLGAELRGDSAASRVTRLKKVV